MRRKGAADAAHKTYIIIHSRKKKRAVQHVTNSILFLLSFLYPAHRGRRCLVSRLLESSNSPALCLAVMWSLAFDAAFGPMAMKMPFFDCSRQKALPKHAKLHLPVVLFFSFSPYL